MIKTNRALIALVVLFFTIFSIIMLPSCSVLDRVEPTPSYLYVQKFEVVTESDNSQGSNASDIVDGWVYVDGKLIGVFELPAMVPILYTKPEGRSFLPVITVLPGIKNNGISNSRAVYPFYFGFIDSFELKTGVVDTIIPQTKYQSAAVFNWLEDFEDRSISLEKSGVNVTEDSIQLTTDPSLIYSDGRNKISAFVELDEGIQYFENSTISKFNFPRNTPIYMEINYNLDVKMQIGLYVYSSTGILIDQIPVLALFPTEGIWQKTYVSLSEDVNNPNYTGAEFKVFFAARGTSTTSKSRIYLDNLKLITY